MTDTDFRKYYDRDGYLITEVSDRSKRGEPIRAFDLFSIVVWKANRSKSRIAKRLPERYGENSADLDIAVTDLVLHIRSSGSYKERLRVLLQASQGF